LLLGRNCLPGHSLESNASKPGYIDVYLQPYALLREVIKGIDITNSLHTSINISPNRPWSKDLEGLGANMKTASFLSGCMA